MVVGRSISRSFFLPDVVKFVPKAGVLAATKWEKLQLILVLGCKSVVLNHVSIFAVNELYWVARKLSRKWRLRAKSVDTEDAILLVDEDEPFLKVTGSNLVRSGAAILASGLLATIGSLLHESYGTRVGQLLGDAIPYMV